MELRPSKLSTAASQVWNESAGQFHKTDLKIDLGLKTTISSSSTAMGANSGKPSEATVNAGSSKASTSTFSTGYIFGSRVSERVTKTDSFGAISCNASDANINSASKRPMDVSSIFRQISQKVAEGNKSDSSPANLWRTVSIANGDGGTMLMDQLSESANKLAEATSRKEENSQDQQPQAEIRTGEEQEHHLLQIGCKFFQYNAETKQWQERGIGILKLNQHNDYDDVRLVGRQSGSQRVLINSKIFPEMVLEELSDKRIKISAHGADSEAPQLFLIQATPASIGQLCDLLHRYIDASGVKAVTTLVRKRRLEDAYEEEAGKGQRRLEDAYEEEAGKGQRRLEDAYEEEAGKGQEEGDASSPPMESAKKFVPEKDSDGE